MPPISRPLSGKRKADGGGHDPTISPPPTKRKVQSTVSKTAVASFFTPASQKPKDPTVWEERAPADDVPTSLLVAKYKPSCSSSEPLKSEAKDSRGHRIAAFDLDSTLITTGSGKKHAEGPGDWKWWDRSIPQRLRTLQEDGYHIVILTNQAGLTLHPDAADAKKANKKNQPPRDRVAEFKQKVTAVLAALDLPITLYAATGKDLFRKPRTGMWAQLHKDLSLDQRAVDLERSIFVGDAGGRLPFVKNGKTVPKDFSCSDRNFATNIGLSFQTPEEYFLGEAPRGYARSFDLAAFPYPTSAASSGEGVAFKKLDDAKQEMVVFCGPPGAGKSTFFRTQLASLDFKRINQDTLKSKDKCIKAAATFLSEGDSIAIDNTNPDPGSRAVWIELAKKHRVPVRCVWFRTSPAVCEHNDTVRSLNASLNPEQREALPKIAFNGFNSRFKEPKAKEGFQEVIEVAFEFRGTKEDYAIWGRYWL